MKKNNNNSINSTFEENKEKENLKKNSTNNNSNNNSLLKEKEKINQKKSKPDGHHNNYNSKDISPHNLNEDYINSNNNDSKKKTFLKTNKEVEDEIKRIKVNKNLLNHNIFWQTISPNKKNNNSNRDFSYPLKNRLKLYRILDKLNPPSSIAYSTRRNYYFYKINSRNNNNDRKNNYNNKNFIMRL